MGDTAERCRQIKHGLVARTMGKLGGPDLDTLRTVIAQVIG